ncbi:choline-sulfatase [Mesorhizobium sp. 10.2.3]|uniref:choline-sulfatase n=1 Tax=Mesorhizobium sp. 10.2.3 TaxID=1085775 RepID=UPI0010A95F64|nr:choline-sulfatase [Mesorhizobium sp. 10.2.3]
MNGRKPNILILMADQLGAAALPVYGHGLVKTPNLDRIAKRGAVFDNFYSSFPLCAPARLALMTGRLCSSIQAWDNAAQIPSDIPTFAHYLRVLGYRTCLSGKMHFIGPDQLHGFEERTTTDICPADFNWTADWDDPWRTMDWFHDMKNVSNAGVAERALQQDYDEEVAHNARRWLFDQARDADDRPFLLVASFTHPHDPYVTPKRFWDLYDHDAIDMPRVPFIAPEQRDPHSRRLWEQYDRGEFGVEDEHVRNARHAYYGSVSYVDERVGEVLDGLERSKLADNTIVIFLADHGDMLGERGLWYKMSFYDWSSRVPLIMAGPGIPEGKRINANAALIDILPTLVEIAGGANWDGYPDIPDGHSLLPLLENDSNDRVAVSELMSEGVAAPYVMLRKGRFNLTYVEHDPPQLFDMAADPDELHDLADSLGHSHVLADMLSEVERRWDMDKLKGEILVSQRRRRLVYKALSTGKITPWDYQPWQDSSLQYYRGHKSYHDAEARDLIKP